MANLLCDVIEHDDLAVYHHRKLVFQLGPDQRRGVLATAAAAAKASGGARAAAVACCIFVVVFHVRIEIVPISSVIRRLRFSLA